MKLMDEGPFKIPSRRVDGNIIIATWNIQQFTNNKSRRALQYMADICERFDLIALQEIKTDLRGLSRLQALLPGNYRILVCDPTGNSERFAFLYDKRTVIPTGLVCEIGFNVPAKTHRGYQLHRMPYCASFRAGRFDFVVVNAHIYFGKTKKDKDSTRGRDKPAGQIHSSSIEDGEKQGFRQRFLYCRRFQYRERGRSLLQCSDLQGVRHAREAKDP